MSGYTVFFGNCLICDKEKKEPFRLFFMNTQGMTAYVFNTPFNTCCSKSLNA